MRSYDSNHIRLRPSPQALTTQPYTASSGNPLEKESEGRAQPVPEMRATVASAPRAGSMWIWNPAPAGLLRGARNPLKKLALPAAPNLAFAGSPSPLGLASGGSSWLLTPESEPDEHDRDPRQETGDRPGVVTPHPDAPPQASRQRQQTNSRRFNLLRDTRTSADFQG